jgi:hypothetical protein
MIPPEIEQPPLSLRLRRVGGYCFWTGLTFVPLGAVIGVLLGLAVGGAAVVFGGVGLKRAAWGVSTGSSYSLLAAALWEL